MSMELVASRQSTRAIAPTHDQLLEENESKRNELIAILREDVDAQDGAIIYNHIAALKKTKGMYVIANHKLYKWYLGNGSISNAKMIKNEKLDLVYTEVSDGINYLNNLLKNLELDMVSAIGVPSESSKSEYLQSAKSHINEGSVDEVGRDELSDVFIESSANDEQESDIRPENETPARNGDPTEISPRNGEAVIRHSEDGRNSNNVSQQDCDANGRQQQHEESHRKGPPHNYVNHSNDTRTHHTQGLETGKFTTNKVRRYLDEHEKQFQLNNDKRYKDLRQEENDNMDERLDATSRRQLKQELLAGLGEPFNGDPIKYWEWRTQMNIYINEAELTPLDSLKVLRANCKGEPQHILGTVIATTGRDTHASLAGVWQTFRTQYGDDRLVSDALLRKLESFPPVRRVTDRSNMQELHRLCLILLANLKHCSELGILNYHSGMKPVIDKMPDEFRRNWKILVSRRELRNESKYIFSDLVKHIDEYIFEVRTLEESDLPYYNRNLSQRLEFTPPNSRRPKVLHTEVQQKCAYHETIGHSIQECKVFQRLPYEERRNFSTKKGLCYACLDKHLKTNCPGTITCTICKRNHATSMHRAVSCNNRETNGNFKFDNKSARVYCSKICGDKDFTRVCSKTLAVEIKHEDSNSTVRCLCIIDEQSDTTFVHPKIATMFNLKGEQQSYSLKTMDGLKTTIFGGIIKGLKVKGFYEKKWIKLPPALTNPNIPDSRREMANPRTVRSFGHLKQYARNFPNIGSNAEVLILIGADCGEAMKTVCHGTDYPYAHHTALGWALVGPVCSKDEKTHETKCLKTAFQPCEHLSAEYTFDNLRTCQSPPNAHVFKETADDDMPGLSQNDEKFIDTMITGLHVNSKGNMEMPLPLKKEAYFPDNKMAVYRRTSNSLSRLKKETSKLNDCLDIMAKYLAKNEVEEIPENELSISETTNYIPVFPVTHKKKKKVRLVFDSSATFNGKCLNNNVLQGPDENNKIIGVLTRFRHGEIAFSGDVESMFHGFYVNKEDRNLLRFFWFSENNPNKEIVAYRANVHIFGNTCSPAIATFGLRYSTESNEAQEHPEACRAIKENFYVDDLMHSSDTVNDAISILKDTREILGKFNLRLHKLISNHKHVLEAFPSSEVAMDISSLDIDSDETQRTLGLLWEVSSDKFIIKCDLPTRQFTKRGMLSTVNSLYDPLGIVAPIILTGRLLQRQIMKPHANVDIDHYDWDDPLPIKYKETWNKWVNSLLTAENITMRRCFSPANFQIVRRELHAFSDASDDAIGGIIYLKLFSSDGEVHIAFVSAFSKVAPRAATSIPRLELCAAVEVANLTRYFEKELKKAIDSITFYTDSKIVLGYLNNKQKRFSRYVTTRVNSVLNKTAAEQWKYVSSKDNPADIASRPHSPSELLKTNWFRGPEFLWKNENYDQIVNIGSEELLPETIKEVKVLATKLSNEEIVTAICNKTNCWNRAKRILQTVSRACFKFLLKIRPVDKLRNSLARKISCNDKECTKFLVVHAQRTCYEGSYNNLVRKLKLNDNDPLLGLTPFLHNDIIRVGGRLKHSSLPFDLKYPVLLPTNNKVTDMILRQCHSKAYHQGRHITLSALRQEGYHIHRGRRCIDKLLNTCVICKRFRAKTQVQKMADLPKCRLEETPPFTNSGVDVFGPYLVHDGASTRRTNANKKVWAALFTCLCTRAVHIEPLPAMDTAAFRMALQRFIAIRGQCKFLYSDRGTNFVGTKNQLSEINLDSIKVDLDKKHVTWKFTPPGASHFGGVWERKIGSVKNVLNCALFHLGERNLSRDELHTLFQEAACVVNDTPLYEISADPNNPFPITPNMILTLKGETPAELEEYSEKDLFRYGNLRWKRVKYLKEQFFDRWRKDYIQTLQERHKWKKEVPCISLGDIVIVKENGSRMKWPIARVTEIHKGRDELIRSVKIQLKDKQVLERSIHDLVLLVPAKEHKC